MIRSLLVAATLLMSVPALATTVSLKTSDGVALKAESDGSGKTAVVLVHADGESAEDMAELAASLNKAGHRTVRLDLRGHGKSGGTITEEDYPKMVADVQAAVDYARKQGAEQVVVMGSVLGANLALNTAAVDKELHSVVLLSPTINANGVKVSAALAEYGDRPLLLVAGSDDSTGSKVVTLLSEKHGAKAAGEVFPNAGKGVKMLNKVPELESLLLSWVNMAHPLTKVDTSLEAAAKASTETGDIETSGTLLEDRGKKK